MSEWSHTSKSFSAKTDTGEINGIITQSICRNKGTVTHSINIIDHQGTAKAIYFLKHHPTGEKSSLGIIGDNWVKASKSPKLSFVTETKGEITDTKMLDMPGVSKEDVPLPEQEESAILKEFISEAEEQLRQAQGKNNKDLANHWQMLLNKLQTHRFAGR